MVHHSNGLTKLLESQGWDHDAINAHLKGLTDGFESLDLSQLDREVLSYATKLTCSPSAIGQDDIDRLKQLGCDDLSIHDLCAIVSYFNFVNRIADGLGVELEGEGDPNPT